MPLLGLFSKKGRTPSKPSSSVSKAGYSTSNLSLEDDEYVSVTAPAPSVYTQSPPSSSKLALPFRRKGEAAASEQQSQLPYSDPLLDPPPRRSSLFQTFQDDQTAYRSTQSLPDDRERRPPRPHPSPQQNAQQSSSQSTRRFMFNWGSNKERSKSVPSADEDVSFNLKSFRHVRPNSPTFSHSSSSTHIPPVPLSTPTPTPTTTMPSPPVSFQVTSRRPRGNSGSELSITTSQPAVQQQTPQQKMAAGAFRQAARRSSTSLSLTDSPVISPTRASLDDRPPPSLLLSSPARPGTPTRPPRSQPPPAASPSAPRPTATSNPPRKRTNAFTASSSSSSESSDEDEDSDSTDGATGGLSRKTTIRPNQPRAGTLPPVSASVREQIQRATPPTAVGFPDTPTNGATRVQSSLGVYGPGARPRASLSVGALTPSAKEARASVAVMANARLMNAPRAPLKATQTRSSGSDTSESAPSGSDSDEDAPLSSLVLPRRPGTSLSAHSAPTTPRKQGQPLVDLNVPSSLTGKPIRAPPPLARDMDADARQKSRNSLEVSARSRTSQSTSPQTSRVSQAPPPQSSRVSQASVPLRTPLVSLDTSVASGGGRPSALSPNARQSSMPLGGSRSTPLSGSHHVDPPLRPFARRESPASSTGDSSSGKAPLTPRDGSDYGGTARSAFSSTSAGRGRPGAPGHGRKPSVTFEDEKERDRKGKSRERDNVSPQEQKRRERRRSEARAAIELGQVVNGPPPKDEDDMALGQHPGLQPGWPQPGMQTPMQMQMQIPMPPMFNMNMGMASPGAFGFPPPLPGADPAFFAAHQQAMAIAKQTFQYAVAQQALAAANDEWERTSTATGFGGVGQQWSGYGMGMGGMGGMGGMRTNTMYAPPAPRSMYAGSGGGGGGGWGGTGSVYGEAFGPATAGARNSTYSQVDLSIGAQQRPVRPRTKTAPSSPSPPTGSGGRMPAPPSSFRAPG